MTPELKAKRGTKRHCQNEECGHAFYDLARAVITCPYCAAGYVEPVIEPAVARNRMGRPFGGVFKIVPAPEVVPVDEAPVEAVADAADDTILEVDADDDEPLVLDEAEADKEE